MFLGYFFIFMTNEILKEKSTWGGARENAGRPEGSHNKATLDKKIVEEEIKQRVLRSADQLINSQMNLAQGVQMLFKIHTTEKGVKGKPELVTSQIEIEEYLAGEYEGSNDDYYFITTERPDNKALDSLFDRTLGKAVQRVGNPDGSNVKFEIVNYGDTKREIPAEGLSDTDITSV
jgi:hypothetical protein